jgi:hypothetical protein
MADKTTYKINMTVTKNRTKYGNDYEATAEISGYIGHGVGRVSLGTAMEAAYLDAVAKLVEAVTNGQQ